MVVEEEGFSRVPDRCLSLFFCFFSRDPRSRSRSRSRERYDWHERRGRRDRRDRYNDREQQETDVLVLRGLDPLKVNEAMLRSYISAWMGYISSINFLEHKTFSFVEFHTVSGARLFRETCGGVMQIGDCEVRVDFSDQGKRAQQAAQEWACTECSKLNFASRFRCFACDEPRGASEPLATETPTDTLLALHVSPALREVSQVKAVAYPARRVERVPSTRDCYRLLYGSVEEATSQRTALMASKSLGATVLYSRVCLTPKPEEVVMQSAPLRYETTSLQQHQQLYAEAAALDAFYRELDPQPSSSTVVAQPAPVNKPVNKAVSGTRCEVCNKSFPSAEALQKHCRLSSQHKANLGIAPAASGGGAAPAAPALRAAGAGLGTTPQPAPPNVAADKSLSYADRGRLATLNRFHRDEK